MVYDFHVKALHAAQNHQRAVEILHPAAQAHGDQQVVGNLVVLPPQRVLAPGDGLLQPVVGVGEFSGGRAHAGQALEKVVADGIVLGRLLRQFPGAREGLPRGLVIALQVGGVAIAGELRNGRRNLFLRGQAGSHAGRQQTHAREHNGFIVLIN